MTPQTTTTVSFCSVYNLRGRMTKFGTVTHAREGHVLRKSATHSSHGVWSQRTPVLVFSPYCLTTGIFFWSYSKLGWAYKHLPNSSVTRATIIAHRGVLGGGRRLSVYQFSGMVWYGMVWYSRV